MLNITSPELLSSPLGHDSIQMNTEIQNNIYLEKKPSSNLDQIKMPPMEFEVDISGKFESHSKGKSSSSNRTNKFNYGIKKNSIGNFLGESDFTIGKKISLREFGLKNNDDHQYLDLENKKFENKINESSEEGEDLIIGNSVTLEHDDNLLKAEEIMMDKHLSREILEDDLEAMESLSRDLSVKKEENKVLTGVVTNYLTLKASIDLSSKFNRNLSEKEVENSKKKEMQSLKKWKPGKSKKKIKKQKNKGSRKSSAVKKNSKRKNKSKSRSSSKVKLYKMTSERGSTANKNSKIKEKRRNSKTKWSGKKSDRKKKINKLLEKYSKEDNFVNEEKILSETKHPFQQITPVAFSSTFGTNLQQHIRNAKPKFPQKNIKTPDKEIMLKKCKEFKHETQSNLFEVETLNTLTRAEDDYVAKPDYLNLNQKYLDAKVRTVLMGWMGEVSEDLWFCRDTFHMACNYVDRYLQLSPNIPKDKLQLIGLTCLYIASKMEEVQMRNVNDYLSSACNIYTEPEMMQCEIKIITVLDFKLNPPTLNLWANWYMNQWDNFLMSDTFVQQHPMIQESKIVAQFKQGNEESYNLYREFMQYLGIFVLLYFLFFRLCSS